MELYLVRHAHAVDEEENPERPLKETGLDAREIPGGKRRAPSDGMLAQPPLAIA
jgi:phosphohistidine phosphatase SixA